MYAGVTPTTTAENGVGMTLVDGLAKLVRGKVIEAATRVKGIHIIDVLLIFQHGSIRLRFFIIAN